MVSIQVVPGLVTTPKWDPKRSKVGDGVNKSVRNERLMSPMMEFANSNESPKLELPVEVEGGLPNSSRSRDFGVAAFLHFGFLV